MKIDIPITNMEFRELLLIIKKYQNGIVKVNNGKAFWNCELDILSLPEEQTNQFTQSKQQSNSQPGITGKNNVFSNMADGITEAFGV